MSTTTQNVRQVAHVVGYDNEASFSKAFSRLFTRRLVSSRREQLAAPQRLADQTAHRWVGIRCERRPTAAVVAPAMAGSTPDFRAARAGIC